MVNTPETTESAQEAGAASPDRRDRARAAAVGAAVLGAPKLHPFGDLHALQHLSARAARGVRAAFEGLLRTECRAWAEPLEVVRVGDYRAGRAEQLTAWIPLGMDGRAVLCVVDGPLLLTLLDLFFGGTGDAPATMPREFSPAAEALADRFGAGIAQALETAWEPLARMSFTVGRCESNAAHVAGVEVEDVVIVTRFGVVRGDAKPVFVDILYPVAALKPHAVELTGPVVARPAEPDQAWRTGLTRAAMAVRLPVRSVLAEPMVSLHRLMGLKAGDIIPIDFADDVPVMVGTSLLGTGTVGTSNGKAAIRLSHLEGLLP
ncbi:flagellar motor switch protein FliM [Sphingomonas sp. Leaf412]|uniref:FliM/FliN family flagellar motor switch protein n=1 Tax=Sphingomonas sp. Leaf412 TaxID=1736370 RepID=UPI0006FFD9F9|nr:FliM/FliN family flagellar motor switch protein [Sphingomonas sp. Leaf412]KQT34736.1 flagellar motor switch protein FliM [Sphingomonas sp. Leaf412]